MGDDGRYPIIDSYPSSYFEENDIYDQAERFSNSTELWEYTCGENAANNFQYIQFCRFPTINKGWGGIGGGNFSNPEGIVFGDCSITLAEAEGKVRSSQRLA